MLVGAGVVSRGRQCLLVVLMPVLLGVSVRALEERRVALVIGNGAYEAQNLLTIPPNDAHLISQTLAKVHFDTIETKPTSASPIFARPYGGSRAREPANDGLLRVCGLGDQRGDRKCRRRRWHGAALQLEGAAWHGGLSPTIGGAPHPR